MISPDNFDHPPRQSLSSPILDCPADHVAANLAHDNRESRRSLRDAESAQQLALCASCVCHVLWCIRSCISPRSKDPHSTLVLQRWIRAPKMRTAPCQAEGCANPVFHQQAGGMELDYREFR